MDAKDWAGVISIAARIALGLGAMHFMRNAYLFVKGGFFIAYGDKVERREKPLLFWVMFGLQLLAACLLAYGAAVSGI